MQGREAGDPPHREKREEQRKMGLRLVTTGRRPEQRAMSIRNCGKREIHQGQGMGARRKGEEEGKDHPQVREKKCMYFTATTAIIGETTWAGSSVDDLPEQVEAGKVKTRAAGGEVSKAKWSRKWAAATTTTTAITSEETWAASSVDDLPEQVKAGMVKTRAIGDGESKAMCPAGQMSGQMLRKWASFDDGQAAPASSEPAE
jgi:hypothetical protein